MGGSAEMDCCEKAREQSGSPEVLAARLCCAVNCSQPAPAAPAGGFIPQPAQAPATSPLHAAAVALQASIYPSFLNHGRADTLVLSFPPGYIRHSALLI